MARPTKCRRIETIPEVTSFRPCGKGNNIDEVVLTLEELEAIRLKDKEGLEQKDCAVRMEISRPTFQRILTTAREKIAEALTEGKMIRFAGGNYQVALRHLKCRECCHSFSVPYGNGKRAKNMDCPNCGKKKVYRID